MKRGLLIGLVVGTVVSLGIGTGFWAYAGQHMDGERGHMMNRGQHGSMMNGKQHQGMMGMPMMHSNMSDEEMGEYCDRMTERHKSMMETRRKHTEKLNSLVESMKQASGDDRIEAMEDVVVELVNQHNRRGSMMMKSRHAMMKSMMSMHRMDEGQRQQMMNRMQNCPMMKKMMNGRHQPGTPMNSPEGDN